MRNSQFKSAAAKILFYSEKLPCFTLENLKVLDIPPYYLKIILSRLEKKGEIVRLKKGMYTSRKFIEKTKAERTFSSFLEFLATKIYAPSYLSLDYVLYENNLLTEMPQNFTLITRNKTYNISNALGTFIYHKIKNSLFTGYEIKERNGFISYKSTRAKALFDFLYLRKPIISNKEMAAELRLNLEILNRDDRKELREYVETDASNKMKEIYAYLFRHA